MYQKPKTAKRLYFDIIPKTVDEYLTHAQKLDGQSDEERLTNPAWHIHGGAAPKEEVPITFSLLLNLVSASNAEDRDVLWGFIKRYDPNVSPETHPTIDKMVGYAITYFNDFVKPNKTFREPTDQERSAMQDLAKRFGAINGAADDLGEALQSETFAVGKEYEFDPLRDWFKALYEVLLGQSQGPRFGSFAALLWCR